MENEKILTLLNSAYSINGKEVENDEDMLLGISCKTQKFVAISKENFWILRDDMQQKIKLKDLSENFISKSIQGYLLNNFCNYSMESYYSRIMEINNLKKIKTNVLYRLYNIDIDKNELLLSSFEMYKPKYFIVKYKNPYFHSNKSNKNQINSENSLHVILILKDIEMYQEDDFTKKQIIEQNVSNFICFLAVTLANKEYAQSLTTKFSRIDNTYHLIDKNHKIFEASFSAHESTYIKPSCTLVTESFSYHNERIFHLLFKNKNKIEEKIYKAILWLGKSLITKDLSDSFLQVAIALECLLARQERGYIIQPSITATLSETLAFLIGSDADERINYFTKIKNLYKKRSSIVHFGNTSIELSEYYTFFNMVNNGIQSMIKIVHENKYKTIDDIYDYIERHKFS